MCHDLPQKYFLKENMFLASKKFFSVPNWIIQVISPTLNPSFYIEPPRSQIVGNILTAGFKLHGVV